MNSIQYMGALALAVVAIGIAVPIGGTIGIVRRVSRKKNSRRSNRNARK